MGMREVPRTITKIVTDVVFSCDVCKKEGVDWVHVCFLCSRDACRKCGVQDARGDYCEECHNSEYSEFYCKDCWELGKETRKEQGRLDRTTEAAQKHLWDRWKKQAVDSLKQENCDGRPEAT